LRFVGNYRRGGEPKINVKKLKETSEERERGKSRK
jgi:hypothetical protein